MQQLGVQEIVHSITNSAVLRNGSVEEKREKIYPVTRLLLHYPCLEEVARQLIRTDGHGSDHYRAILLPVEHTDQEVPVFVPPDLFDPLDPWGRIFRRGLSQVDFSGATVFIAGGGSGADILQLIFSDNAPRTIFYNDLDWHAGQVARLNLQSTGGEQILRQKNIDLEWRIGDVADTLEECHRQGVSFDYILGCLPQVPAKDRNLALGQNCSHLYDERRHPSLLDMGFGLLADVKCIGRKLLKKDGGFLLVHGREPKSVRQILDEHSGCIEAGVVWEEMVRHHAGTPLEYLSDYQGEPILFSDPDGQQPLNPRQAEELRLRFEAGEIPEQEYQIYHSVAVVRSTSKM